MGNNGREILFPYEGMKTVNVEV